MNMKAQFWSFDVIFSIVIFSVAITVLAFTWYQINSQLSIAYGNGAMIMQMQASALASTLLSPGSPSNWNSYVNTTNASTWSGISIGIGTNTSSIDPNKLYTLMSMANYNYQATKQALGVGFDYYISITGQTSRGGALNISIGENPGTHRALTVYVEKRSSYIDGMPVQVVIELWTNTPFGVE
ncbi:MAG: hypothetical protein ACP5K5_01085 [Candidatus Micrarchaeia archaeon]